MSQSDNTPRRVRPAGKVLSLRQRRECMELYGVLSDAEIGRRYGVSSVTILRHRRMAGVDAGAHRMTPIDTTALNAQIREAEGTTAFRALAEATGISESTLRRRKKLLMGEP